MKHKQFLMYQEWGMNHGLRRHVSPQHDVCQWFVAFMVVVSARRKPLENLNRFSRFRGVMNQMLYAWLSVLGRRVFDKHDETALTRRASEGRIPLSPSLARRVSGSLPR